MAMKRNGLRLFPELAQGASLRWCRFLYADGTWGRDVTKAIATRRAGGFVRLSPAAGAAHWIDRSREPRPTAGEAPPSA